MAPMPDKERERLLKLGTLARNRLHKDQATLNAVAADEAMHIAKSLIYWDAMTLLILGKILDNSGRTFTLLGVQTKAALFGGFGIIVNEAIITTQVHLWEQLQLLAAAGCEPFNAGEEQLALSVHSRPGTRDFLAWSQDFLQFPISVGRPKCSFCGNPKAEYRVLQACGNCKKTLYCDTTCQKMSWKKGHKKECQKAANGGQVKDIRAAENETETFQGEKQIGGDEATQSKTEDGKAADNKIEGRNGGEKTVDSQTQGDAGEIA